MQRLPGARRRARPRPGRHAGGRGGVADQLRRVAAVARQPPAHEELQAHAAAFFGTEAALFFGSGYATNIALFATPPQPSDFVVHDTLVHASAHEGMRLGRAAHVAVLHNGADAFADAIARWRSEGGTGTPWIAAESFYSMDGDRAPLAAHSICS